MSLALAPLSRAVLRRLGVWLALGAVLLQLLALPVSAGHMARESLRLSRAIAIPFCSLHGTTTVLVDEKGQPIQPSSPACAHCPFCFLSGAAPLPVLALTLLLMRLPIGFQRPLTSTATARGRCVRPPGQAPPFCG